MLVIRKSGSGYDIDYGARTSIRVDSATHALEVVKDALDNERLTSGISFAIAGQKVSLMTEMEVEREFGLVKIRS